MVNFAAKVQKHRKPDLLQDEQVLAAVFGSPIGAVGEPADVGSDTLAMQVGERTVVATITDQRVLFFGHGALTGRPKRLVATFEFDRIGDVGLRPGKDIDNVRLQFVDTSVVEIEVTPQNDPEGFVNAWKAIRSR